ncbi:hypothetical protein J6590_095402, partial [Homalodisca vitripennis]
RVHYMVTAVTGFSFNSKDIDWRGAAQETRQSTRDSTCVLYKTRHARKTLIAKETLICPFATDKDIDIHFIQADIKL